MPAMRDPWAHTPSQRYQDDPTFRRLVDSLEHLLHQAQTTPSELREACLLAHIHYEQRRGPRPFLVTEEEARAMGVQVLRKGERDA
jgi:hypothetical protein